MIGQNLTQKLNEQIGHEQKAAQMYLGIAIYFDQQNLDTWAKIFYKQSEEEQEHARKIIRFLVDVSASVRLAALEECPIEFPSAEEAVRRAYEGEKQVTEQFKQLTGIVHDERDYVALDLVEDFLEEQVEEVAKMEKYLDIIRSGANLYQAQNLLIEEGEV